MVKWQNFLNLFRKIRRFGFLLPFTGLIITYLEPRLPYSWSRKLAKWRHRKIETQILKSVGELPDIREIVMRKSEHPVELEDYKKEFIWVLWLQGETQMPDLVKTCVASIRKNANGHKVVLLDKHNIDKYIQLEPIIWQRYSQGFMKDAHLSDYIRMKVLAEYGGLWLDATMLFVAPISESWFKSPFFTLKSEPLSGIYVSDYRWSIFMMSSSNAFLLPSLVMRILQKYWERESVVIDYFLTDYIIDIIYNNYPEVRNEMDKVPNSNPNLHSLAPMLLEQFDDLKFKNLTKETTCFKLSWKQYTSDQLNSNTDSLYSYLKGIALSSDPVTLK